MQNKKGFTLIEIIVTIALLGIIGTVIAINVVGLSKKQNTKETIRIEQSIKAAAEAYEHVEDIGTGCLSIKDLIDNNYLKESNIEKYKNKYVEIKENADHSKSYEIKDTCNGQSTPNKYKIVYNKNLDETVSNMPTDNNKYQLNQEVEISTRKPTTFGYDFKYWSTSKNGLAIETPLKMKKNGITLYAIWQKKTFTVNYNTNGGTPSVAKQTGEYKTNITISANNPSKTGYSFQSWKDYSTNITYFKNNKIFLTRDITLNAQYTANIYTITLNHQDGQNTINTLYEKYNSGFYADLNDANKIASPSDSIDYRITNIAIPTKSKYTFQGYYTQANGKGTQYIDKTGKIIVSNTTITQNITLYAYYTANIYTITLNHQNGKNTINNIYEKYNDGFYTNQNGTNKITSIAIPTRSGYKFQGYYTQTNGQGTKYIDNTGKITISNNSISQNITLYAYWKKAEFNFHLEYYGADLVSTSIPQKISQDDTIELEFKGYDKYVYSNTTCVNAEFKYNTTNQKLTVSNPTNDVTCTVNYYKSIYLYLNSNNNYNINYVKQELKKNKLELDYNESDTQRIISTPSYDITTIESNTANHELYYIGVLGNKFFFVKKQKAINTGDYYSLMGVYDVKNNNFLTKHNMNYYQRDYEHQIGWLGGELVIPPMIYQYVDDSGELTNTIYFAKLDHIGTTTSGDGRTTRLDMKTYYYDKDIDVEQYHYGYVSWIHNNKGTSGRASFSYETSDSNPFIYKVLEALGGWSGSRGANINKSSICAQSTNLQLCKSLKNLSNNLIDPKNNKVFDYEKVSVSNEEMNALSIDKIKEAPKYSSAKSPSAIQLIHDNNDEVYYFEDNNGDKGVLVSYRPRASQAYYDRVVYSHNSLLYYISPIDTSKDLSNYYANYYLLDLKGIETIEDYFYDTENSQIGNKITKNNFPKDFTKLYLNYNSNKTLPEPLKNGISLTNITEVKNKIIEDNSK